MKMNKEQKQAFMRATYYRDLSDRFLRAAYTLFLGSIFLWFINLPTAYVASMMGIGVVMGGIGFWQREKYWKCPSCGAKLPTQGSVWQVESCPKCGLAFGDEKKK